MENRPPPAPEQTAANWSVELISWTRRDRANQLVGSASTEDRGGGFPGRQWKYSGVTTSYKARITTNSYDWHDWARLGTTGHDWARLDTTGCECERRARLGGLDISRRDIVNRQLQASNCFQMRHS